MKFKKALICLCILGSTVTTVEASTLTDLINSKTETQQAIQEDSNKKDKVQGKINNLVPKITELAMKQANLQEEINEKQAEVDKTRRALKKAKKKRKKQYEAMKERIRVIYENSTRNEVYEAIDNFSDFLNKGDYVKDLSESDDMLYEQYKATEAEVSKLKAKLEKEKADLDKTKEGYDAKRAELDAKKAELDAKVAELQGRIDINNGVLLDLDSQIEAEEERLRAKVGGIGDSIGRVQIIAQKLKDVGYPDTAISAILGNLYQENRAFEPILGDRSCGYGIAQWTSGGYDVFMAYCNVYGNDPCTLEGQVDALIETLNDKPARYPSYIQPYIDASMGLIQPTPPDTLKNILMSDQYTVEQKTWYFCCMYEMPYYENSKLYETRVPKAEVYLASIQDLVGVSQEPQTEQQ